jgi:hypothetical protein
MADPMHALTALKNKPAIVILIETGPSTGIESATLFVPTRLTL